MRKTIVVFGSSRTSDERHLSDAERLGRLLAEKGFVVGSGGYSGIMDAVSKGAYEAGGHVIAYTTDLFSDFPPTTWFHEERKAEDIHCRIRNMLTEGAGFIAVWGGIGTLAEVAMAWNMAQISAMQGMRPKPLVLMGDHWRGLVDSIGRYTEIGKSVLALPVLVSTPEEAVETMEQALNADRS